MIKHTFARSTKQPNKRVTTNNPSSLDNKLQHTKKDIPLIREATGQPSAKSHFLIIKGLEFPLVDELKETLLLSNRELADLLGISESKLQRKRKANESLSRYESDRLFVIIGILKLAIDVFENDKEHAATWLKTSQIGLGGNIPLEMASTVVGANEVRDLLGRILYGVYS